MSAEKEVSSATGGLRMVVRRHNSVRYNCRVRVFQACTDYMSHFLTYPANDTCYGVYHVIFSYPLDSLFDNKLE